MGNKQGAPSSHPPSYGPQATRGQQSQRARVSLPKMGNSNSVKKHVEMAEKTGACQLVKFGLDELPADLTALGNLRTLDVSENKIQRLPAFLGQFNMLKSLQLSYNRLTSLPEEIGQLRRLETLNVTGNQLSTLPAAMANLKALKTFLANQNKFVAFPDVIYGLRNLDMVDLSSNKITAVPDGIQEIQAIEINLNQNQISVLSGDVARCPRLKVLRLEENCLERSMITADILKESQIALLVIDGNLFPAKDFPHFDGYEEYQERYTATKRKMG